VKRFISSLFISLESVGVESISLESVGVEYNSLDSISFEKEKRGQP
jgi:hypothetical protein